jgi:hypothetical protein
MKRFISLCVILMLAGANLMAQSSPIKISLEDFYNQFWNMSYPKIYITSVVDNLEIKNVIVNKGHCTLLGGKPIKNIFPKKLHYSQRVEIPLSITCHVIRIDIKTNQGDWNVEY